MDYAGSTDVCVGTDYIEISGDVETLAVGMEVDVGRTDNV